MRPETITLIMSCCATLHLAMTCVLALYARHQVKYLSLAWIMGIFTAMVVMAIPFCSYTPEREIGMLHPLPLMLLMAVAYLQSIFPLSIPMPGYLQWARMWRYASPALIIIAIYSIAALLGGHFKVILTWHSLLVNTLRGVTFPRIIIILITLFYIANIFRLPHRLTHIGNYPRYLIGYSTMLGLSAVFYLVMACYYTRGMALAYLIIFTLLNLYLVFRTLESMAEALPHPDVDSEETNEPTPEQLAQAEADFNEANQQRYHRTQYWMQHHREDWKDNTFGRDRLCEETGINRHLMLQSLRSQGFNNVHDYINSYRIAELKRMIKRGEVHNVSECLDVGFGTAKTARTCFLKHEGISLDDYLRDNAQG